MHDCTKSSNSRPHVIRLTLQFEAPWFCFVLIRPRSPSHPRRQPWLSVWKTCVLSMIHELQSRIVRIIELVLLGWRSQWMNAITDILWRSTTNVPSIPFKGLTQSQVGCTIWINVCTRLVRDLILTGLTITCGKCFGSRTSEQTQFVNSD